MSTETSNKKTFKFLIGKQPRKPNPLACGRKGVFRAHTMKMNEEKKGVQITKPPNSQSNPHNSLIILTTTKDPNSPKTIHFNNFEIQSPLDFCMRHNVQEQRLRSFIYSNFSSPSHVLHERQVSQLGSMLPSSELQLADRLLANSLKIPLRYSFDPPVYRGPAQDCTSIGFNPEILVQPKMIQINKALKPLEEHMLKLFFRYSNPFFTVVHPDYFDYRLKQHWNRIDFQALLAMILCCSCPYLAVEPFDMVVNHSQLAEMYFERSYSLYAMIDPNDLSAYPSKIQTNVISVQFDYNSGTQTFSRATDLAKQLGWFDLYTKSTHEILSTQPNSQNLYEQYEWEENLIIWCFLVFYSNMVLTAKVPIDGLRFEMPLPSVTPALDALFHDCAGGWMHSLAARLVYFLYLGHPIFERARIYNHNAMSHDRDGGPHAEKLQQELQSIKLGLKEWKMKLYKFTESCRFKPNELALVTGLHLFYHYAMVLLLMPHLPRVAHELADSGAVHTCAAFLSSCGSLSVLTACQGIWMILHGGGAKNLILSVVWSGVRLIVDILDTFNSSESIPQLIELCELASLLDRILISQLQKNLNFAFQRKLNDTLVQRRSLLFWLAIRHDRGLANLSAGLKLRSGCDPPKPPKLSSHSTLNLLS